MIRNQENSLMQNWKHMAMMLFLLLCVGAANAKDYEQTKVYMFGFAASFNDSTVYFTEIQAVDDAWVYASHGRFLVNRDDYSYQLRNYLQRQGLEAPTCVTVYALGEKEIEKKYAALRQRYEGKKSKRNYFVKDLPATAFAYRSVEPDQGMVIVNSSEAEAAARKTAEAEAKAQKKARKKARKEAPKNEE